MKPPRLTLLRFLSLHGFQSLTPRKTTMTPENQWLEDVFPSEIVPFERTNPSVFGGVMAIPNPPRSHQSTATKRSKAIGSSFCKRWPWQGGRARKLRKWMCKKPMGTTIWELRGWCFWRISFFPIFSRHRSLCEILLGTAAAF